MEKPGRRSKRTFRNGKGGKPAKEKARSKRIGREKSNTTQKEKRRVTGWTRKRRESPVET